MGGGLDGLRGAFLIINKVRSTLMGSGLDGLRGAFFGLGSGLAQMMRDAFIEGSLSDAFVGTDSDANKDSAGQKFVAIIFIICVERRSVEKHVTTYSVKIVRRMSRKMSE
jgi:hypothetical protein